MNEATNCYREQLQKELCIPCQKQSDALQGFERMLSLLLEEIPDPSERELMDAFGAPEDLAQILCQCHL